MSLIKEHRVGITTTSTTYRLGVAFTDEDKYDPKYGGSFNIEFVHHNGYTKIRATTRNGDKEFGGWLNLFNTRFQANLPKYILFRKQRVIKWALKTLERAYATWLKEQSNG